MMASPFSFFLHAGDLMPYLVAMGLAFGGVALIYYSVRSRQLPVSDRVDMLLASPQAVPRVTTGHHDQFLRLPEGTMPDRERREVARVFTKLGVRPQYVATAFTVSRAFIGVGLALVLFVGGQILFDFSFAPMAPFLLAAMGGIGGWLIPTFVFQHLATKRSNDVAGGLPDALELLVVCVGAGLALEDGIDRIVTELKFSQPALAEELALTSADLKILPSRDQALANLASRVDVPSVRSVVATLSQTMRYGTPLVQALRVVATEMRSDALIQMEARANRLPTYLTIPMMLFIMPTIFLIVGGPAALKIIDLFF